MPSVLHAILHSIQLDQGPHMPAILLHSPLDNASKHISTVRSSFALRLLGSWQPTILLPHRRGSPLCLLHVSHHFTTCHVDGGYGIDLLLNSVFFAFSSLTRLARMEAYSFYRVRISHTYIHHVHFHAHIDRLQRAVGSTGVEESI